MSDKKFLFEMIKCPFYADIYFVEAIEDDCYTLNLVDSDFKCTGERKIISTDLCHGFFDLYGPDLIGRDLEAINKKLGELKESLFEIDEEAKIEVVSYRLLKKKLSIRIVGDGIFKNPNKDIFLRKNTVLLNGWSDDVLKGYVELHWDYKKLDDRDRGLKNE